MNLPITRNTKARVHKSPQGFFRLPYAGECILREDVPV